MEPREYIDLLVQAPLAVILIIYIYKSDKRYLDLVEKIIDIIKKNER